MEEKKRGREFYYHASVQGCPKQFSPDYIEWLVNEFGKDAAFFDKARQKLKETG